MRVRGENSHICIWEPFCIWLAASCIRLSFTIYFWCCWRWCGFFLTSWTRKASVYPHRPTRHYSTLTAPADSIQSRVLVRHGRARVVVLPYPNNFLDPICRLNQNCCCCSYLTMKLPQKTFSATMCNLLEITNSIIVIVADNTTPRKWTDDDGEWLPTIPWLGLMISIYRTIVFWTSSNSLFGLKEYDPPGILLCIFMFTSKGPYSNNIAK